MLAQHHPTLMSVTCCDHPTLGNVTWRWAHIAWSLNSVKLLTQHRPTFLFFSWLMKPVVTSCVRLNGPHNIAGLALARWMLGNHGRIWFCKGFWINIDPWGIRSAVSFTDFITFESKALATFTLLWNSCSRWLHEQTQKQTSSRNLFVGF